MPTKLTLRLDESLIEQAKRYADTQGRSVSQLVAAYFASLTEARPTTTRHNAAPITRKLRGSIKQGLLAEEDYKEHLRSKYR